MQSAKRCMVMGRSKGGRKAVNQAVEKASGHRVTRGFFTLVLFHSHVPFVAGAGSKTMWGTQNARIVLGLCHSRLFLEFCCSAVVICGGLSAPR